MENPLRPYIYKIGNTLGTLGEELCRQADSQQPLNIHGHVKQAVDNLTYNLHNLCSDLDTYRFNLIKKGNGKVVGKEAQDIETAMVAMQHLLHSAPYTHNGERTSLSGELHKLDFLISSLYRLMANGAVGRDDYIFDKINEKDL